MAKFEHRMNVAITDNARQALDRVHQRTRMPRKVIFERTVTWFAKQDLDLQAIVLGQVSTPGQKALLKILAARTRTVRANKAESDLETQ